MSQITTKTINPYGKDLVVVETEFCGRTLTLEVNRVGFRTTASVLVRYGDTVVLGTAMLGKPIQGMDYFPLSIDYEEKFYAAGLPRFVRCGRDKPYAPDARKRMAPSMKKPACAGFALRGDARIT